MKKTSKVKEMYAILCETKHIVVFQRPGRVAKNIKDIRDMYKTSFIKPFEAMLDGIPDLTAPKTRYAIE